MKLLVTGAAGMLGQDVVRCARADGHDVVPLTRAELDVTDPEPVSRRVLDERPDAVVNCAAYTNVDGAEGDRAAAMAANADAARNLAAAAAGAGLEVVYPSTDYVFDGTKGEPYVESDEPAPLSVYGMSKLRGEQETIAANPRHHVVRSAWLFGAGGGNFVETMLRLGAERKEVAVVEDQLGCPTYTRHLAAGLLRLLGSGAYGVHHMAAAGECSWLEFAREIFRQAGVDCRLRATTTEALARPAPRPAYSVLASEHDGGAPRLPPWREGLAEYLAERGTATGMAA